MEHRKVHLTAAFGRLTEFWSPETVARVNDYDVRVAKLHGEYHWHRHDDTDELFLCVSGGLIIKLRDRADPEHVTEVTLTERELFVVPRGVEHQPIAHEEAHVLLLEPAGTSPEGTRV